MIARRRILAAASALTGLAVLTACEGDPSAGGPSGRTGDGSDPAAPSPSPEAEPDPDLELLRELVDGERAMVEAYAATVERHPNLADRLGTFADHHDTYLTAFRERLSIVDDDEDAAGRSAGKATPKGTQDPASNPPKDPEAAVEALAGAESDAAEVHLERVRTAAAPMLARLLASISAAETVHANALLSGGGR